MSRSGPPELCSLPLVDLAERIGRREVSPVEVVGAHLDRIEERDPAIRAFVSVLAEDAVALARGAEARAAAGERVGPLDGVPVAVKDLFDFVPGVPNTFGSVPLADWRPARPSVGVERLRAAGCVVLGKTNVPEFGHKGTTDNDLVGPTSTPFGTGCNAGGSSGGSAAAVATGMAAGALGSDGAGSIRIPAALCGVYGLKPSFGRVPSTPRPNGFRATSPLVSSGPITRTVADAAALLDLLAGEHPRDPYSLPGAGGGHLDAARRPPARLRVAWSPDLGGFPVDPAVARVAEEAVGAFEACGYGVEPVEVRFGHGHAELCEVLLRAVAVSLRDGVDGFLAQGVDLLASPARDKLTPEFLGLVESAEAVTALRLKADDAVRTAVFDAVQDVLGRFDVLVAPTVAVASVPNDPHGGTVGPRRVAGEAVDPLLGWCLTYPFNFTGHPAASVPAGLTADGFPVGLQIVGPRFGDALVIAASAAFEAARPWHGWYSRH
jgi:Asp-tRNA(Asn)/Glu-tRNA(Gln) amidotransferase A subunit family amidase